MTAARTPTSTDYDAYARAWDSLSEADKQVLLKSAREHLSPKVPAKRRSRRKR